MIDKTFTLRLEKLSASSINLCPHTEADFNIWLLTSPQYEATLNASTV